MKEFIGTVTDEDNQLLKAYFLNPGQLIFSKKAIVATTILGSCVAVCIHDAFNKFGGMCHYLLPEAPRSELRSTKYGDTAIKTLLNKFSFRSNSVRQQLYASIIGGASISYDEREFFFVGDKNIDLAFSILKQANIRIFMTNTGGEHGRKLSFSTAKNFFHIKNFSKLTIDDLYNPYL